MKTTTPNHLEARASFIRARMALIRPGDANSRPLLNQLVRADERLRVLAELSHRDRIRLSQGVLS